jgi:hypothetical protein
MDIEKKRTIIFILFGVALILNLAMAFFYAPANFLARATSSIGSVVFSIIGDPIINITSPENITYNFSVGSNYTLDLNLTSNILYTDLTWNYSLYDLRHGVWVYPNVAFLPNTTLDAVRWNNQLFVEGVDLSSRIGRDNVTFFIFVPNSAPVLGSIDNPVEICEGQSLFYNFNATDADEDFLLGSISGGGSLFFVFDNGRNAWGNTSYFVLLSSPSSPLTKSNSIGSVNLGSRNYSVQISAVESGTNDSYSDTKSTNITVIEINNPPFVEDVGARTIWNKGENSTLFEQVEVNDTELTIFGYGGLTFNTTITNLSSGLPVNLFNVSFNGTTGIINFTANNSTPLGNYNVTMCANDTGLTNIHPNILVQCGQSGLSKTTCDSFSLTITDQNRKPTIINYTPTNLTLSALGTSSISFSVTTYDPDGNIPDAYWYVDGVLREHDEGDLFEQFGYTFGCGVSGEHRVRADVTDGLLNDSVQWNITVIPEACPVPPAGGGGGGGGGIACVPLWGCTAWNVCQNAQLSLEQGILSGLQYRTIQQNCTTNEITDERCGVQIRVCDDLKSCKSNLDKPEEFGYCLFIENPSCSDGYKNCHDGECELLVDCGGPCSPCPSCSDKIKNQGEEGADCGGPCPWRCEPEVPLLKRKEIIYGFLILLLLIIALIVVRIYRIVRYRRLLKKEKKPNL